MHQCHCVCVFAKQPLLIMAANNDAPGWIAALTVEWSTRVARRRRGGAAPPAAAAAAAPARVPAVAPPIVTSLAEDVGVAPFGRRLAALTAQVMQYEDPALQAQAREVIPLDLLVTRARRHLAVHGLDEHHYHEAVRGGAPPPVSLLVCSQHAHADRHIRA
jgi:hypothetical protein